MTGEDSFNEVLGTGRGPTELERLAKVALLLRARAKAVGKNSADGWKEERRAYRDVAEKIEQECVEGFVKLVELVDKYWQVPKPSRSAVRGRRRAAEHILRIAGEEDYATRGAAARLGT